MGLCSDRDSGHVTQWKLFKLGTTKCQCHCPHLSTNETHTYFCMGHEVSYRMQSTLKESLKIVDIHFVNNSVLFQIFLCRARAQ